MAYIGRSPLYGSFEKQPLSPDGSTTTFSLDYTVGSSSSILVSIAGVVQEPEVAYNLSSGGTQIVFAAAPGASDTVFVIYLGVSQEVATIGTGAITSQTALTTGVEGDDTLLVYDNSATALKKLTLDDLVIGQTAEATVADDDQILVYDTSASALRKMTKANFAPTVSSDAIIDADSNTQIQVEESADENIIRFDTAGTERLTMDADGKFAFTSAGGGVINSTTVSNTYSITNQNLLLAGPVTLTGTITVGSGATMVVV